MLSFSLPPLPQAIPFDPPSPDASPSDPTPPLSPEAQAVIGELWDPLDHQVDLRRFAPRTLDEIAGHQLGDCRDARFVAVPAHCSVQAIHTLLTGLPALEVLFAWSPAGTAPIRPLLGRCLTTLVSDTATLSRAIGGPQVRRVAGREPALDIQALRHVGAHATARRRPNRTPGEVAATAMAPLPMRPWSLHEGQPPSTVRNDAVGYRLAHWADAGPNRSRAGSPLGSPPGSRDGEAPRSPDPARSARESRHAASWLRRSASSALAKVAQVPALLRRSRSI